MAFLNEHLTRQRDIIPMDVLGKKITIIGAGAIGSWTALALAKMGFEDITVFDHDAVDTVNLNSQFFRHRDVGVPKVVALANMVADFTGVRLTMKPHKYEGKEVIQGIVISAVDSMEVRKMIWDAHKHKGIFTNAIIDPRMGAESASLYVMNPMDSKDITSYEKSLYTDDAAVQERCTAKATIYTANMLAGLVCKAVKDLLTRPDYLRMADWSIKEDQFFAYRKAI